MSKKFLLFCGGGHGSHDLRWVFNIAKNIISENSISSVDIVYGGRPLKKSLVMPNRIKFHQLSELKANNKKSIVEKINIRNNELTNLFTSLKSVDFLLIDMYPFSKSHFKEHYDFLLKSIKGTFPQVKVGSYVQDVILNIKESKQATILNEIADNIDVVFVCGEQDKNDLLKRLPFLRWANSSFSYAGFVVPKLGPKALDKLNKKRISSKIERCVISVGAGVDDFSILKKLLVCLIAYLDRNHLQVDLIITCYYNPLRIDELSKLIYGSNINIHSYSGLLIKYLMNADVHICMGRYNSVVESFQAKVFPIIIADRNNMEQLKRATYLDQEGLAYLIEEEKLNKNSLEVALDSSLLIYKENKIPMNLNGGQYIAKKMLTGELNTNNEQLMQLQDIIWLIMNMEMQDNENIFLSVWNACVAFSEKIEWTGELLKSYLDTDNDREYFIRVMTLPKVEFLILKKEMALHNNTSSFSLQFFEKMSSIYLNGNDLTKELFQLLIIIYKLPKHYV